MPRGSKNGSGKTADAPAAPPARVEPGSGNVFADLGLPNPDLALAKAELVRRLRYLIAEQKLTPAKAADLLGLEQPRLEALIRGRTGGFSLDRLFRFLTVLGQQVVITIRSAPGTECRVVVGPPD